MCLISLRSSFTSVQYPVSSDGLVINPVIKVQYRKYNSHNIDRNVKVVNTLVKTGPYFKKSKFIILNVVLQIFIDHYVTISLYLVSLNSGLNNSSFQLLWLAVNHSFR